MVVPPPQGVEEVSGKFGVAVRGLKESYSRWKDRQKHRRHRNNWYVLRSLLMFDLRGGSALLDPLKE